MTIKQLVIPSEIVFAMACRSRCMTCIGVAASGNGDGSGGYPSYMSTSAACRMSSSSAGILSMTSAAQRLMDRSSWDAACCHSVRTCMG